MLRIENSLFTIFRKVQEYSPSEAAKVYEKALNSRKNIAMFNPQTALHELRPETAQQRETVAGHIEMSKQIVAVSTAFVFKLPVWFGFFGLCTCINI